MLKLAFIKHILCAKNFTFNFPCSPQTNPMTGILLLTLFYFIGERSEPLSNHHLFEEQAGSRSRQSALYNQTFNKNVRCIENES